MAPDVVQFPIEAGIVKIDIKPPPGKHLWQRIWDHAGVAIADDANRFASHQRCDEVQGRSRAVNSGLSPGSTCNMVSRRRAPAQRLLS